MLSLLLFAVEELKEGCFILTPYPSSSTAHQSVNLIVHVYKIQKYAQKYSLCYEWAVFGIFEKHILLFHLLLKIPSITNQPIAILFRSVWLSTTST